MKIALAYDLRGTSDPMDAECDSPETIAILRSTIESLGHTVTDTGNALQTALFLTNRNEIQLCFGICEAGRAETREALLPAVVELLGVPAVFSDSSTMSVCLDKTWTSGILSAHGIAVPRSPTSLDGDSNGAVVVKPRFGGTSIGVRFSTVAEARNLDSGEFQIEEALTGREYTVAVLGTGERARPIGTVEILSSSGETLPLYGFEEKERCEEMIEYRRVSEPALERLALITHRVLRCRDASRIDIRLDHSGAPYVLEVNPLPGLHPTHSDLPIIAFQNGIPYTDLIEALIKSAADRIAS
jgi:D-alanine-D-alanine ligase